MVSFFLKVENSVFFRKFCQILPKNEKKAPFERFFFQKNRKKSQKSVFFFKKYSKSTLKVLCFLQKFWFQNENIINDNSFYFCTEKIIVTIRKIENYAKQSTLW